MPCGWHKIAQLEINREKWRPQSSTRLSLHIQPPGWSANIGSEKHGLYGEGSHMDKSSAIVEQHAQQCKQRGEEEEQLREIIS